MTGVQTCALPIFNDSFNVTSITDNSTGDYTVTWDTDFASANYAVVALSTRVGIFMDQLKTAGAVYVNTLTGADADADAADVCVIAFGAQ